MEDASYGYLSSKQQSPKMKDRKVLFLSLRTLKTQNGGQNSA